MLILTSIPPITGPILSPFMAPITVLLPQWVLIILFAVIPFYMWLSYWPGRKAKVIPIRASAFSPDKVPSNIDTIVIGSGSGGSSCSNILAQSGQKVLLLEQHEERTGGCTHTFRINNCEWDTGMCMWNIVCAWTWSISQKHACLTLACQSQFLHRTSLYFRRDGSSDSSCGCFVEVHEPWEAGVETIVSKHVSLLCALHRIYLVVSHLLLSIYISLVQGTIHTIKSSSRTTKM